MTPPQDMKARILAAARAEPSPARSVVRARVTASLIAAVSVSVAIFAAMDGVRVTGRPLALVLVTSLGLAGLSLAAAFLAVGRGRSMLGRPRSWLIATAIATPLVLLAWKYGWSAQFEDMTRPWIGQNGQPPRLGLKCLGLSFATAVGPFAAFLLARRGTDPVHPRATAAAIGTAVGACAGVLVDLWCPVGYFWHLMLGHVLPIVALTAIGAIVGARVLGVRARA